MTVVDDNARASWLPTPDHRCPTGQHVGTIKLPLYANMVIGQTHYVCGCRRP